MCFLAQRYAYMVLRSAKPFNNETHSKQGRIEHKNNNNALFSSSFSYEFFIMYCWQVTRVKKYERSIVRQNNHDSHHHHALDILWFLQLFVSRRCSSLLLLHHLSNELQCGTDRRRRRRRNIPTHKSMLVFDDMTTATHA